jgi:RNA recognition motif-containing protein
MSKKLYVRNLAYGIDDRALRALFQDHGRVESAQVALDRATGRSKGFGFVEMQTDDDAQAAIAGLNGKEVSGRVLAVCLAQPRERPENPRRQPPGGKRGHEVRKRPPALGRRLRRPPPQDPRQGALPEGVTGP